VGIGDWATWVATIIAFCTGVAGFVLGLLGYRQARQANALAARNAARAEESWFVDWHVTWNPDLAVLVLTNRGSNAAIDTSVTVAGPYIHEVRDGWPQVGGDQNIDIPLPVIPTQRAQYIAEQDARFTRNLELNVVSPGTTFVAPLKVTVRWKTGLGSPADKTFDIDAT
jgi:hypothetical protein